MGVRQEGAQGDIWTKEEKVTEDCMMKSLMICTYHKVLLTNSMEQSPSWKANRSSASKDLFRVVWNPKDHYRIHKRRPPFHILSQIIPVNASQSEFLRSILMLSSYLRLGFTSALYH
jgi:hypothetical protein